VLRLVQTDQVSQRHSARVGHHPRRRWGPSRTLSWTNTSAVANRPRCDLHASVAARWFRHHRTRSRWLVSSQSGRCLSSPRGHVLHTPPTRPGIRIEGSDACFPRSHRRNSIRGKSGIPQQFARERSCAKARRPAALSLCVFSLSTPPAPKLLRFARFAALVPPRQRSHSSGVPQSRSIDARSRVELFAWAKFRSGVSGEQSASPQPSPIPKIVQKNKLFPQADSLIRCRFAQRITQHKLSAPFSLDLFPPCDLFLVLSLTHPRQRSSPLNAHFTRPEDHMKLNRRQSILDPALLLAHSLHRNLRPRGPPPCSASFRHRQMQIYAVDQPRWNLTARKTTANNLIADTIAI